jgi:serine/threonine protein kinase
VLLDIKWHVKLADFGDSKMINEEETESELLVLGLGGEKREDVVSQQQEEFDNFDFDNPRGEEERKEHTFVGTPLYVSPEMLNSNLACYGSDLWALGCILY